MTPDPLDVRRPPEDRSTETGRRLVLQRVALGLAVAVVVVGLGALLDRALGGPLPRLDPGVGRIRTVTWVALVVAGAGVVASRFEHPVARRASVGLVALLGLLGAGMLLDGLVTLRGSWWVDPFGLGTTPGPARTGPSTYVAASTAVLGLALSLGLHRLGRRGAAGGVATLVLLLGVTGATSGVYGATGPSPLWAMPTLLLFACVTALASGLVLGHSAHTWVDLLVETSVAGEVARRLFPVAVVVPLVAGLVLVEGASSGWFAGPFGVAALVMTSATVAVAMVWWQARRLRSVAQELTGATEALRVAEEATRRREELARELARTEHRMRRVLDTAVEAYVALDLALVVTDWNEEASRLFGWTRAEAIGARLADLVLATEERGSVLTELLGDTATGGPPARRELRLAGRWGRSILVDTAVWTVTEDATTTVHALLIDITGRRAEQTDLQRAHADLQYFSTGMAHDLRTPLTIVRATAEMLGHELREDPATVEVADRWVPRLLRAADRGVDLIDTILAFVEVGASAPGHARVDLDDLVHAAAEDARTVATRPATIRVGPLGSLVGDEVLLRQLFANLVTNALKYVPEDREVQIRLERVPDPDAGLVVLHLDDNGVAVPEEDRERIFTLFLRGREAARTVGGAGVGLAVCRRVAEIHHGDVTIEPGPAGGNRFVVQLRGTDHDEHPLEPGEG